MRPCLWTFAGLLAAILPSCSVEQGGMAGGGASAGPGGSGGGAVKTILIDGSSTVAPISSAVAEIFGDNHPDVQPRVNVSGTTGGFDKFIRGETDINDASRAIKPQEVDELKAAGIGYVELQIGTDGLSVVMNTENDWCDALTIAQLTELWKKDSPIETWSDLNLAWPEKDIKLFGPDSKSGTYDYFKEETVGADNPIRSDYQANVDDNVLATGIGGEKYALGYFGFAYYIENQDQLKALGIVKGEDVSAAVKPTRETIENGTYTPLSRPLFIYVRLDSLQRPEVAEFAKFYLSEEGQGLVARMYVRLSDDQLAASRERLEKALSGAEVAAN